MVSQSLVAVVCLISLTMCWRSVPQRPIKHRLPKGSSLLVAGFRQNYRTAKMIWKHYDGLKWWYISTIFGEASASAVGTTAVVFLTGNLQLTAQQIGIFFEVSLIGVIFGTKVRFLFLLSMGPDVIFTILTVCFDESFIDFHGASRSEHWLQD